MKKKLSKKEELRLYRRSPDWLEAPRQAALLVLTRHYRIPAAIAMVPRPKATFYFDIRALFKSENISDYKWAVIGWGGLLGRAIGRWGFDDFMDDTDEFVETVFIDWEHDLERDNLDATDSLPLKYPDRLRTLLAAARILKGKRSEFESACAQIREKRFSVSESGSGYPKPARGGLDGARRIRQEQCCGSSRLAESQTHSKLAHYPDFRTNTSDRLN